MHYPNSQPPGSGTQIGNGGGDVGDNGIPRLDDQDTGYRRPPLKGTPELFDPKGSTRSTTSPQSATPPGDHEAGGSGQTWADAVGTAALVEKMGLMTVTGTAGDLEGTPVVSPAAAASVSREEHAADAQESS